MIDIKLLRSDLSAVIARLDERGYVFPKDEFLKCDRLYREVETRSQKSQADLNIVSTQIAVLKSQGGDAASEMAKAALIPDQKAYKAELAPIEMARRALL